MNRLLPGRSGVSVIATLLTLLFLSVFAAVVVSVVTTASSVSQQEEHGLQALYVAEGGLQYAPLIFNFPNYITPAAVNLGRGSFSTAVPQLTAAMTNVQPTMDLTSTDGFQPAPDGQYWTMVGLTTNPLTTSDTVEKISFTTMAAAGFSGGTRGRDSSSGDAHPVNAVVMSYTWDTAVTTTLNGPSGTGTPICVNSVASFAAAGIIRIVEPVENNNEDILYTGLGTTVAVCGGGCTACFTGCIRGAYSGGVGNNHGNGRTVYQAEISVLTTSTGIVPGVVFTGNVQRTVQAAIMPIE